MPDIDGACSNGHHQSADCPGPWENAAIISPLKGGGGGGGLCREHMTRDKEDRYCVAVGLRVSWQGRGPAKGQGSTDISSRWMGTFLLTPF